VSIPILGPLHRRQPASQQQLVNGGGAPPRQLSRQSNDVGVIRPRTWVSAIVYRLHYAQEKTAFSTETPALVPGIPASDRECEFHPQRAEGILVGGSVSAQTDLRHRMGTSHDHHLV
jgi:hypothetical protein